MTPINHNEVLIKLEQVGVNIEVVANAGHSMARENPKGLAVAIKNGGLETDKLD